MSDYRRLISYIYEYEGKIKGKNVGFVKLEARNGQCRLNLNVKKVYVGGNAIGVYLLGKNGAETFLGNIFIRGGNGEFRATLDAANVESSGNGLDTYYGLTVHDVKNPWRSYTTIWEDILVPEEPAPQSGPSQSEQQNSSVPLMAQISPEQQSLPISLMTQAPSAPRSQQVPPGQQNPPASRMMQTAPASRNPQSLPAAQNSQNPLARKPRALPAGDSVKFLPAQEILPGSRELRPAIAVANVVREIEAEIAREEKRRRDDSLLAHAAEVGLNEGAAGDGTEPTHGPGRAPGTEIPPEPAHEMPNMPMPEMPPARVPSEEPDSPMEMPPVRMPSGEPDSPMEMPPVRMPSEEPESPMEMPPVRMPSGEPESPMEMPPVRVPSEEPESPEEMPPVRTPSGEPESPMEMPPVRTPSEEPERPTEIPSGPAPGQMTEPMPVQSPSVVQPQYAAPREQTPREDITLHSPELEDPDVLRYLQETEDTTADPERLWQELRKSYPKIQPFDYENGCEILTIRPQDIGRLPRESWVYGNNSFLLHGYYNFRYIILFRLGSKDGRPRYMIGVPGHYYSSEKYMASMFGFPNFVLSKKQPPNDGRFGYWYTDIKVR